MTSRTQIIMGTFITISLEDINQEHIESGFKILKNIDSSLSSYDSKADIYQLNLHQTTSLNKYTYEALTLSKKYYQETHGYFDITIGSITKKLFHFGEKQRIPSIEELDNATLNIQGLVFNQKQARIQKDMHIDLGGMGKGFGVDKVAAYLKSKSISKGIIAASGDIRCLDSCKVEVQDPFFDGNIASFDTLKNDTAVSTSGNYNRYVKTVKNNHLINPKEKKSQNNFISITLISNVKNSDLDAYATATSVMPRPMAYDFLKSRNLAYIILQSDLKMVYSENIAKFTKNLCIKYTQKK